MHLPCKYDWTLNEVEWIMDNLGICQYEVLIWRKG